MTRIRIDHGLPDHRRPQAAELYWQAFGGKLGRVLGPRPLALTYLARVMRADHCLTALSSDGRLLGIAGFKTAQGLSLTHNLRCRRKQRGRDPWTPDMRKKTILELA